MNHPWSSTQVDYVNTCLFCLNRLSPITFESSSYVEGFENTNGTLVGHCINYALRVVKLQLLNMIDKYFSLSLYYNNDEFIYAMHIFFHFLYHVLDVYARLHHSNWQLAISQTHLPSLWCFVM